MKAVRGSVAKRPAKEARETTRLSICAPTTSHPPHILPTQLRVGDRITDNTKDREFWPADRTPQLARRWLDGRHCSDRPCAAAAREPKPGPQHKGANPQDCVIGGP